MLASCVCEDALNCRQKLGSRIESDPNIAASESTNQELIVNRV